EQVYFTCDRTLCPELPQFRDKNFSVFPGFREMAFLRLDDNCCPLRAGFTQSNQRAAADPRMLEKDRLTAVGQQPPLSRLHAFSLPPAEPKFPVLVQVAEITHAVPNAIAGN